MGSSKPAKGCYLCMRRRIICDKAIPHCNKCKVKGLACPGYGVRFRFVPINTVIARGDPRMASSGTINPAPEAASRLASNSSQGWSQGTLSNPQGVFPQTKPLTHGRGTPPPNQRYTGLIIAHNENPHLGGYWNVIQSGANRPAGGSVDDLRSAPYRWSIPKAHSFTPPSGPIPRIMDPIDAMTRFLLDHFAERVSSLMISFDGNGNGYRDYVLPLAHVEPMIQQAVCTTAAFHLAQHMPHLLGHAEKTRAVIIRNLRKRSHCISALDDVTWAVISLLILGELFTGSEDIRPLYHTLTSFMAARGTMDLTSPLAQLLTMQARLISFFSRPFMAGYEDTFAASRVFPNPMGSTLELNPGGPSVQDNHMLPQDLDLHYTASEIYLLREESRVVLVNEVRMTGLLQHLRVLLEHSKYKPGSYTLVWPCFLGAVEARSEDDRRFFSEHLRRIWEMAGSETMPKTLDRMPTAWERGALGGWTERFSAKDQGL
ncbi:hypothetical protein EDB81DRAFT_33668 [Dactylonectria macrodidyma]|uniref:Zn(2)-C6 fungal-type domain-containing protein n=1 Tax=Dactylonectria macrodidyma TaxID=307937 RepID=A0A9P9FT90_9HYPO|nr:hypothetical protein EDB81DRAFT_33668 [Dactylonectria macrodidyma]